MIPPDLFHDGYLLGSVFLGGVVGNLTASFLWDGGKWVCKPLLDKIPALTELFAKGGADNNHDLLRALRRAECRVVVALCDQALLDSFHLRTGKGSLLERLRSRLREREDPEIRALCCVRREFAKAYDELQSLSVEELARMHGAALADVPALVQAGSECFVATSPDQVRDNVVSRQIEALDRVVRNLPEQAGLSAFALRTLAFDGLPPSLKRHMEKPEGGWWDLLRLAFREELKDPANERARIAWEMDVLSLLPQQLGLGRTYAEFETKLAALDEKLTGVWDEVKRFRHEFDIALAEVMPLLEGIDETTRATRSELGELRKITQEGLDRIDGAPRQLRAQRPPWQLPPRALAGTFFGRADLLAKLVERLKRRGSMWTSGDQRVWARPR